uniref:Uncharacterized protein n=1 Tax=Panagrolaimus davidi TaxID=227884 RepID=A0A914QG31_9BILA
MDIINVESQGTCQTPTSSPTSEEKAPSTAPTSPPKAALGQLTTSQFHEMKKIRQKLLQQQEKLRQKQEEKEEDEKALLRQPIDSQDEEPQPLHQHLVNPSYGTASPAPSPTLQQGFIPVGNYAYFNYQPQSPPVSLPQVSNQPMNLQPVNLQRSMHPSQYRQERPPPQLAQGEEKQRSLRQQSSANDSAAAVPQPVKPQPHGTATPSQVERQLPAETLEIFNKIRQNFKESLFSSEEDFVRYAELRQADNFYAKKKAAWITFKATDDVKNEKAIKALQHRQQQLRQQVQQQRGIVYCRSSTTFTNRQSFLESLPAPRQNLEYSMPQPPIPPFHPYYGYPPPYVFAPPTPSSTPTASVQPNFRQPNQAPMRLPSTASEHSTAPPTPTNGQRQPITAPIRRTSNSQAPAGTFGIYDNIRNQCAKATRSVVSANGYDAVCHLAYRQYFTFVKFKSGMVLKLLPQQLQPFITSEAADTSVEFACEPNGAIIQLDTNAWAHFLRQTIDVSYY